MKLVIPYLIAFVLLSLYLDEVRKVNRLTYKLEHEAQIVRCNVYESGITICMHTGEIQYVQHPSR